MTQHKDLTGADLHEPKGVTGAPAGSVYVSNGSGTGVWKKVGNTELDRTGITGLTTRTLQIYHPNIRTNNKSAYAVIQVDGTLTRVAGILDGSPTEDTTITLSKNGVTPIGNPVLIAAGSPEGVQFAVSPLPTVTVVQGDFIKVAATGGAGGSNPIALSLQVLFTNN